MSFLESDKKVFLVLFTIYLIVNIPLLLNYNGIYWDDWVLVGQDLDTLNNMFTQAIGYSGYIASYIHYYMINYLGVYSYRILTFLLLFGSAWFVYKILSTLPVFSYKDRFFITLFFLIAPLYNAKIALINFPYTLFTFIFFLTFYFLSRYYNYLTIFKRIVILSLFFLSFYINSILIFYSIVLLYIFYIGYSLDKSILKNTINFIKKNTDFILLPIVFYIVKSIWFKPSGLYEGYNSIELVNIFEISNYIDSFELNIIQPIIRSFGLLNYLIIVILFIGVLLYFKQVKFSLKNKHDSYILILGILIFFLGCFPYIAVGKIPYLEHMHSRIQNLLFLGFSIMLYYVLKIISYHMNIKNTFFIFLLFLFCLTFSLFNLKEQLKYNIDWFYQQGIMENLKSNQKIIVNNTFIVTKNIKFIDGRKLGFSQMNGMAKLIFGDDNRLFVTNEKEIEKYKQYQLYKQYNFSTWVFTQPIYFIFKNNPKNKLDIDTIGDIRFFLRLKYLEIVNNEQFKKAVKDLVILELKE